ncbi:methyl-accepting chemotaxis protein [Candidatus Synechococcus calcipolaris G9]|uniref:Methyl-accepting chemotaxis protein n=1 Tax=Candidatus Synechococcus calcipolaris G9 TaxID=1497997 RepID=A0ABT6EZH0_9SYNE|nr:methyl-accepting chemotaxis protein [Candidatus Synechococcus calcipolaris]MDG2991000.1 methyl-accepting chemotaxis protein [Candidatus Synechococcus calcipolaris G9]
MRIRYQLYLLTSAVGFMAISSLGIILFSQTSKYPKIINEAGLVRGGTQRIVKLRLLGQVPTDLITATDERINTLINGDPAQDIPPATDPEFRQAMQNVQQQWDALKVELNRPQINTAAIAERSEELFDATNNANSVMEKIAGREYQRVFVLETVVVVAELIILVIVGFVIQRITKVLSGIANQIASASTETAAAIAEQEKVIAQQAASVNQTTTTMEELGASSRQSAEQADASSAGAKQTMELSTSGLQGVRHTTEGIDVLKDNVSAIAEKIMQLSEQTTQITSVSELVADIANQTNILALNAAVEAARAGEQGKGFSVVAQEVRKLADQSKKSAEKITALIRETQASINSTVMVTDEGTKTAAECIKLAQSTRETFETIADSINSVFVNSQQIALSSKQQAVGVQQAVSAMNAINLGAREASTSVSQIKTATQQLLESAQTLKERV